MLESQESAEARDATIQAARELYGEGSDAERALIEAWTAVGLNLNVIGFWL